MVTPELIPLQKVFQLAAPVLIAWSVIVESELTSEDARRVLYGKLWWQVLETTRHMLAHPHLTEEHALQDAILETIMGNLRALMLVARIDLTSQHKWKWLGDDVLVSMKPPTVDHRIWVDRLPTVLLSSLQHPSYQELLTDFDTVCGSAEEASLLKRCRHLFGHFAYTLKARDDDNWKLAAAEFRLM